MRILITGATGFIGFHLARELSRQGHQIVAAVRQPQQWQSQYPAYHWIDCDFRRDTEAKHWAPRLENIDLVINAVGIIQEDQPGDFDTIQSLAPQALFAAAAIKRTRVIQMSALGADEAEVKERFLASKRQADQYLLQRDNDAVVFYPSIVIGRGGTSTALFNQMAASPIIPLMGDGHHKLQPLHIEDLCKQVAYIVQHWPGKTTAYRLVGPTAFSMKELYALLREWMRLKPALFLPVPMAVLRVIAKGAERIGVKSLLSTDSLDLLEKAQLYPVATNIPAARPLAQALWDEPATYADTWYARLMLVRPLLLAAMAFVWIFTALTSACFDLDSGYALLAAGGIEGVLATFMIYLGALADLALGIGMLTARYRLQAMRLQIALMVAYSIIISVIIPAQWLHPFGPVTKNLPMMAGTLLLLLTDRKNTLRFVKGV